MVKFTDEELAEVRSRAREWVAQWTEACKAWVTACQALAGSLNAFAGTVRALPPEQFRNLIEAGDEPYRSPGAPHDGCDCPECAALRISDARRRELAVEDVEQPLVIDVHAAR